MGPAPAVGAPSPPAGGSGSLLVVDEGGVVVVVVDGSLPAGGAKSCWGGRVVLVVGGAVVVVVDDVDVVDEELVGAGAEVVGGVGSPPTPGTTWARASIATVLNSTMTAVATTAAGRRRDSHTDRMRRTRSTPFPPSPSKPN